MLNLSRRGVELPFRFAREHPSAQQTSIDSLRSRHRVPGLHKSKHKSTAQPRTSLVIYRRHIRPTPTLTLHTTRLQPPAPTVPHNSQELAELIATKAAIAQHRAPSKVNGTFVLFSHCIKLHVKQLSHATLTYRRSSKPIGTHTTREKTSTDSSLPRSAHHRCDRFAGLSS